MNDKKLILIPPAKRYRMVDIKPRKNKTKPKIVKSDFLFIGLS